MNLKIKLINLIFSVLLLLPTILGLEAKLVNPQITFRLNESEIIEHSIILKNTNNISVSVLIDPPLNLKTNLDMDVYELLPGETKEIPYIIQADKTGVYRIGITYSDGSKNSIGVQQKLNIIINDNNNEALYLLIVLSIIFLILLVIFIIMMLKTNERRLNNNEENNIIDNVIDRSIPVSN